MTDDEYIQSLCQRVVAAPAGTEEFEAAMNALRLALAESTARVREKIKTLQLAVLLARAKAKHAA